MTSLMQQPLSALEQQDEFIARHVGSGAADRDAMLAAIGVPSTTRSACWHKASASPLATHKEGGKLTPSR